ncbi:MAG: DUF4129 domain-containing protein [Chloroflexota bacterium]
MYALLAISNDRGAGGQLSVFGLLLLYPIAFFLNMLLLRLGWHALFRNIIHAIVWVAAVLLTIKFQLYGSLSFADMSWLRALPQALGSIFYSFSPELWILAASGLVWWLGRRLAQTRVTFTIAVAEFQFGLFFLLILFFAATAFEVKLSNAVPLALVFFLFSLVGISIAHAEEGESWLSRVRQGYWLPLLFATIGVILVLGLLIGSLLTPDFIQTIVNAIVWVWNFLWDLFIRLMLFIARFFPEPEPSGVPDVFPSQPQDELAGFKPWELFPDWLRNAIRLGWSILMISILVFALWRMFSQIFSWMRRRFGGRAEAEYESMPGAFKADFLGFLKRLFYRILGLKLVRWQKKVEAPEISSIRQIYRQLLSWAATQDYPRLAFQTPYEYLYTLEAALPESREPLEFITQSYVSARYGRYAPSEAELDQLKESWHQVKQNRINPPSGESAK